MTSNLSEIIIAIINKELKIHTPTFSYEITKDDNFIDIGGDSMIAKKVTETINYYFHSSIRTSLLLSHDNLSDYINEVSRLLSETK
jgi:hypothetical protein